MRTASDTAPDISSATFGPGRVSQSPASLITLDRTLFPASQAFCRIMSPGVSCPYGLLDPGDVLSVEYGAARFAIRGWVRGRREASGAASDIGLAV